MDGISSRISYISNTGNINNAGSDFTVGKINPKAAFSSVFLNKLEGAQVDDMKEVVAKYSKKSMVDELA